MHKYNLKWTKGCKILCALFTWAQFELPSKKFQCKVEQIIHVLTDRFLRVVNPLPAGGGGVAKGPCDFSQIAPEVLGNSL